MSRTQTVLALSATPDALEPALDALSRNGMMTKCVNEPYRFVASFVSDPADLVVVDSEGFRKQELEMLRLLREIRPDTGIVALIERDQRDIGTGALVCGADLYLLKPVGAPELLAAIERADVRRQLIAGAKAPDRRGEMLSKFSVGVTQKINDSLVIISMPIQFLIHEYAKDERLVKELASVKSEVDRLGNFSHQLLAFAQQSAPEARRVDVGRILADLGRIYAAQCRQRGVDVVTDVPEDLPNALGDEAQLRQACDAILEQTVEAMGGAGRIEIVSRPRANGVEIVFQDNGPVIPPHLLDSLFDPLQAGRRGSGKEMGLAMAAGIIQSHGGKIEVQSNETPLTRFVISLPAAK